jgi:hypothetical protein
MPTGIPLLRKFVRAKNEGEWSQCGVMPVVWPGQHIPPRRDFMPYPARRVGHAGRSRNAQAMAAHESPRTTKLYNRTADVITLDEVERIVT